MDAGRTLTAVALSLLGLGRSLSGLFFVVLVLICRRARLLVGASLFVLELRALFVGLNQLLSVLVDFGLNEAGAAPLDLVIEREVERWLELPLLRSLAMQVIDRDRVEEDEDGQEQPEALRA